MQTTDKTHLILPRAAKVALNLTQARLWHRSRIEARLFKQRPIESNPRRRPRGGNYKLPVAWRDGGMKEGFEQTTYGAALLTSKYYLATLPIVSRSHLTTRYLLPFRLRDPTAMCTAVQHHKRRLCRQAGTPHTCKTKNHHPPQQNRNRNKSENMDSINTGGDFPTRHRENPPSNYKLSTP